MRSNPDVKELAKPFASFSLEALKRTFTELDGAARERAKPVSLCCAALTAAWDELLPVLDEMQSFLSQRGEAREKLREAELPGWTEWFNRFQKETGLQTTLRTVQNRLAKFRSKAGKKPKKSEPAVSLSPKNQRRLLTAQQFANELVNAIEHDADYAEPLREYKRVAMGSDCIAELLDGTAGHAETLGTNQAGNDAQVDAPPAMMLAAESSATPASVVGCERQITVPRAGAWIDLANTVVAACRKQLEATFEGLEPREATEVFGKFMQRVAQTCCRYRHGGSLEMNIEAEYIGPKPPKSHTVGNPSHGKTSV